MYDNNLTKREQQSQNYQNFIFFLSGNILENLAQVWKGVWDRYFNRLKIENLS